MALDVSPNFEAVVAKRVREGHFHSTEDLLATALHILDWAERHPDGKRELVRYKLQAGVDDAEAGNLLDADEMFRKLRNRARGESP